MVHLAGRAAQGGGDLFILPAGYRPTVSGRWVTDGTNNVQVSADGRVSVNGGGQGMSLEGVHFRAADAP